MGRINYNIVLVQDYAPVFTCSIRFRVDSNVAFPFKCKIYNEGGAEPAYAATNYIAHQQITFVVPSPGDVYRIKILDVNNNEFYIGRVNTVNTGGLGMTANELYTDLRVTDTGISLGLVDGTSAYGVGTPAKAEIDDKVRKIVGARGEAFNTPWTNSELDAADLDVQQVDVKILLGNPVVASYNPFTDVLLNPPVVLPPLTVTYETTNETAAENNDGTITLFPAGGSGNYSFVWGDGPLVQNRGPIPSGVYSVTVTDTVTLEVVVLDNISITEPAVPPKPNIGTILRVPELNSITFVTEVETNDCDLPQTDENTLLANQVDERFIQTRYYQPILECDVDKQQFESDFQTHVVKLFDHCGAEVRTFEPTMVQENIGVTQDFNLFIKAGPVAGVSKVFFQGGLIPIPLSIGDPFTILNNGAGFNGDYLIVSIVSDNGSQYLLINKLYDIGAISTNATGRFLSNAADYNVYEWVNNMVGLPVGRYYFVIEGTSDNMMRCISEPVNMQKTLKDFGIATFEVIYRNRDNGWGNITWTTGYIGRIRLPGYAKDQPVKGGTRKNSTNADFSITKVNAKATKIYNVRIIMAPPYINFKAGTIFDCDFYLVNRIECQSAEALSEPEFIEGFRLANSTIKLQKQGLFKKYNSNDLGNIISEGLITTVNPKGGYIKR